MADDVFGVVSVYSLTTGAIVAVLEGERSRLVGGVPAGHGLVDGRHNGRNRRVNLQTGEVEPYQPPAPDADHEWDAAGEEWVLSPATAARIARSRAAQAQIDALEAKQPRALRELALGQPGAQQRLQDIDDQITALRQQL